MRNLPKIELHCHLDGSLRIDTAIDLAKKDGITLESYEFNNVKKLLSIDEECSSLDEYLEKFHLPNKLMQSKDNLKRIAFELMEDGARENIKYMEIRFAPILHINNGLTLEEAIEAVIDGIKKAEDIYDIKGNVIISCMRNFDIGHVYDSIKAGQKFIKKGVVGIDLAATEKEDFAYDYIEAIKEAKRCGFRITIHAGETGFGKNVGQAVELLEAERIGHGIYIYNDEEAYKIVKEKGTILEVCPKSNIDTKAINEYREHPLYNYYKDDIKITLNTDNRTVSNINLSDEIDSVMNAFNLSLEDYKKIYINSVNAAFCDEETKERLLSYIV